MCRCVSTFATAGQPYTCVRPSWQIPPPVSNNVSDSLKLCWALKPTFRRRLKRHVHSYAPRCVELSWPLLREGWRSMSADAQSTNETHLEAGQTRWLDFYHLTMYQVCEHRIYLLNQWLTESARLPICFLLSGSWVTKHYAEHRAIIITCF